MGGLPAAAIAKHVGLAAGVLVGMFCGSYVQLALAQSGVNLLKNPGFDWPAQLNNDVCSFGWQKGNAITPHEWIPYWACKSYEEANQDRINREPEFTVMTVEMESSRVRSYPTSARFFTFWSLNRSMGLYQVVRNIRPGARLRFSIWANLLTTDSDILPLSSSRDPGGLQVRACIHTDGMFALQPNFADPNIVCSDWARPYDRWEEVSVEAMAKSDTVTVFVDSTAEYPVKHNDVYVDDASLVVVDEAAVPSAPAPPQPAPTSSGATPQVIVKTTTANVRATPLLTAAILATAPQGTRFTVRAYTADQLWWQIEYPSAPEGVAYIHHSVVSPNAALMALLGQSATPAAPSLQTSAAPPVGPGPSAPAKPSVIVNTGSSRLKIRAAPSPTAKVLTRVRSGTVLEVLGISPDKQWWQIAYPSAPNRVGWVMAQFVVPNEAARALASR
ncbi:MAG: SH3 domain-containing protein [Thermoflexales bacterium]